MVYDDQNLLIVAMVLDIPVFLHWGIPKAPTKGMIVSLDARLGKVIGCINSRAKKIEIGISGAEIVCTYYI